MTYRVLILGASYGSLFGTKLLMAAQRVTLVCTRSTCYTDPGVWEGFDPALVTLASPDPQAFRPPDQPKNVLQVGLPTNFKAARFSGDEPTRMLRNLETAIDEARFDAGNGPIEVP